MFLASMSRLSTISTQIREGRTKLMNQSESCLAAPSTSGSLPALCNQWEQASVDGDFSSCARCHPGPSPVLQQVGAATLEHSAAQGAPMYKTPYSGSRHLACKLHILSFCINASAAQCKVAHGLSVFHLHYTSSLNTSHAWRQLQGCSEMPRWHC